MYGWRSNSIVQNWLKEENFWLESCRFFLSEDTKQSQIVDIDAQSYYGNNKFAIFIDLRFTEDNQLHGSEKIQLSGDDILLTMTKKNKVLVYTVCVYILCQMQSSL